MCSACARKLAKDAPSFERMKKRNFLFIFRIANSSKANKSKAKAHSFDVIVIKKFRLKARRQHKYAMASFS